MLPNQRNSRRIRNDSCFGLTSRKHRILFRQLFTGSSVQKKLLIFVFFAAAGFSLTLGLIIYLGLKYYCSQTTCTKPECIMAAHRLLEGMNRSADPCEDFYEYICGNWQYSHPTSDDINSWFSDRLVLLNREIKSYLNSKGLQPVYDILDLIGLPRMLPPEIPQEFNLAKVLAMSQKLLNLDIFVQLSTHFNKTLNTTFLTISPSFPRLTYVRPYKKSINVRSVSADEFLAHTINYMTAVIKEFTPDVNTDDISRAAMRILLLETQLKVFSWQDYISTLTDGSNASLQMNDKIAVVDYKYFRALGIDLINYSQIEFLISEQYVWWKIIDDLVLHTTDRIRSHRFIFYERVYNGMSKYTRSSECISLVKFTFRGAITYALAKRDESSNYALKGKKMMSRIKNSLKQMMKNSVWLDLYSKAASIKKVDDIEVSIGYPERSLNSTLLTERFSNVNIVYDDFMSTLINIYSVPTARIMKLINSPYGYLSENESLLVDYNDVNSFYQRELSTIFILPGLLKYPFFIDGVESLNYGALGTILGHELMHGFDRTGLHTDWTEYEREVWDKAFSKRAECFINQYREYYIIDNKTVDGELTLSENIADNEGLRSAFYAYEDYVTENGAEPALPAFENFSHQQLFFMSFANAYCIKDNEFHKKYMLYDVHSPQSSRIMGSLSNMPEFAKSWNCPPNVPMNRFNKCSLW